MAFPLPRSAQPVECWIPPEDTYGVGVKGSREAGPMRVPVNTGPRLGGDNSVSQVQGPENDLIVYNQIKSNQPAEYYGPPHLIIFLVQALVHTLY